jgi:hypothetical protein
MTDATKISPYDLALVNGEVDGSLQMKLAFMMQARIDELKNNSA